MRGIYCAGEQAGVVLDTLRRNGRSESVVLFDDDESVHGDRIDGCEVVGGRSKLTGYADSDLRLLVSYGKDGEVRRSIAADVGAAGFDFFSAIDPRATISDTATVRSGVMLNAETYVGPGVKIGKFVLVDSCVNISHDCEVKAGATICPGATIAGGVTIGENAFVGSGATVIDHQTVGDGAVVGAGAVVTDDVEPGTTVVGVPAERTRES